MQWYAKGIAGCSSGMATSPWSARLPIAESMDLNPKTIADHQSAIKQKLGAETAIQLLKIAAQLGLEPG
jgi:hypothetical protein